MRSVGSTTKTVLTPALVQFVRNNQISLVIHSSCWQLRYYTEIGGCHIFHNEVEKFCLKWIKGTLWIIMILNNKYITCKFSACGGLSCASIYAICNDLKQRQILVVLWTWNFQDWSSKGVKKVTVIIDLVITYGKHACVANVWLISSTIC